VQAVSTTSLPTDRNECTASAADDVGAVRRTVADFEYDPTTGVLVEEVANAETEFAVTTFRHYDAFGNIVRQVTEAPSLAPRVAETTFDARGRFAIGQQNALGHRSTLSFDEQLALVVETKDPNGVTTRSQYDGFGRLTEMVSPTGMVATEASYFADVPPISGHAVALVQTKVVGDMPPHISFLDVQGRVLRTQVEGFDVRPVFSDAQYDAYGRTSAASLPYYEGETIYWGTVWYDALNRPVVNVRPDGAETVTRYLALTTTVTDPLGGETETERDLKGNTIRTVDQKGDVVEFEYGAGELLLSVSTIADGVTLVTEHAYDAAGNRVSTTDPDLGTWSYQYNAFGQLVWQRDAKGQDSTISYDAIGRVSSFVRPDSVVKYSYDSKPFGIGQVSVMTSNRQIAMAAIGTLGGQTYAEEFEYDGYSRPFRKVTTVNGEVFAATLRYDEHNRPIEAAYPGGFVVRNSYDEQGLLSQVRVKEPNQPIGEMGAIRWEALERDQQGRILKERFGNDVETSHAFDPQRGFESLISAQNASGTTVLDLSLSYDAAGNLVEKHEAALGQTERFEYDNAYRLVEWELNGESEGRYEYDGRGRLLYKSGVGRYDYEGRGPAHGVKQIIAPDGSVQSYEYDPNGNLIIGPKGHFNFFSDNLVQHIYASPDYWSSFQYAPDGSRYLHSAHDRNRLTETLTIGPYEQIREHYGPESTGTADLVRRRLYVMGDTGIIAVVEDTVQFDPFGGDSPSFANGSNELIAKLAVTTHYLQKDQLGSVVAISNGEGAVTDRFSYDPWGAKDWQANKRPGAAGEMISGTFHRGFTGHEHLDHLALIHMNGRVYDPTTAQFVSADPQVQVPFALDTYNRYSYASNNPLRYFDPSGYGLFDSIGDFFGGVWDAITSPYRAAWSWLKENWRTVVVITVAVALSTVTAGIGGAILIGAVSGGLNAALYGGSFSDIMRGGIIGAFTGAATFGAGSLGASVGGSWGTVTGVAGHGVVGGAGAEMNGGNFWSGFAAGATTKAFAGSVSSIENTALETVAASAVGGTASVIGGGKFTDGAITGAYSHLLNDVMHRPASASTRSARPGALPRAYVGGFGDKLITGPVIDAYETYGTVSDKYFTWDQSDELAAWIQKHGGEVEVYAHSWGADTAAEVVAAGNRVELLVTADPVGYTRPSFQAVNDNATSWVNKNAQGPASIPNFIAGIGRAWNEAPASYAKHELMKNADHADYCDMAKGACR
jgi:RHS repeat-associated protein